MNLKAIRKKHNLTQQNLADLIKCHVKTIERYENGHREIPFCKKVAIREALK